MNGWIKLHRSLLDNPRAKDPDWVVVWVYLLLHATHKPHKALFGGNIVELQPGQLVTGRKKISLETGVNEPKTKRVLFCLESDHQIGRLRCSTSSLITITKWDQYQASDQPNGQQMDSEWTANGQRVDTKQEGKEGKKVRRRTPPKPPKGGSSKFNPLICFEEMTQADPLEWPILAAEEFRISFKDWLKYRKGRKSAITERAIELQLKRCQDWGVTRAIRNIETTIERGWLGLRDPEEDGNFGFGGKKTHSNDPYNGGHLIPLSN